MDKFVVKGPCKVKGKVNISGSKNSALPILASTLLFDEPVELRNVPNVRDIQTMIKLLRLNKKIIIAKDKKKIKIYNMNKKNTFCSYSILKTMRAGILCLGGLISKYKSAVISFPGGCAIGTRPINYHLNALKKLGMKYVVKKGYIHATAKNGLKGNNIRFKKISVGATENLIIASILSHGTVFLRHCAIEPEIKDLCNFLNSAGAKIKWIGKRTVKIVGVKKLNSTSYSVMGDRIETVTWCVLATLTAGKLKINGFNNVKLIKKELDVLSKIGASIKCKENQIEIQGKKSLKNINLITKEYPDPISTDMQAQFGVLLCKANGKSTITERIFEHRFRWVAEARRLGAKIEIKGNKAIIEGNAKLQGAEVMSPDLRSSVALVLAAIFSTGRSVVTRVYNLDRGMEKFEHKLRSVGVEVKRVS